MSFSMNLFPYFSLVQLNPGMTNLKAQLQQFFAQFIYIHKYLFVHEISEKQNCKQILIYVDNILKDVYTHHKFIMFLTFILCFI